MCLHRWLFTGISRYKAIELLMLPNNHNGAFLIRESETSAGLSVRAGSGGEWMCYKTKPDSCYLGADCYSLSILRKSSSPYLNSVKHYRISSLQNSWVYISPRLTFPSLHHLVEHYSGLYRVDRILLPVRSAGVLEDRRLKVVSFQSLQMVCVVDWQLPASSRARTESPSLCPQLSGGPPSTGRTSTGGVESLFSPLQSMLSG